MEGHFWVHWIFRVVLLLGACQGSPDVNGTKLFKNLKGVSATFVNVILYQQHW